MFKILTVSFVIFSLTSCGIKVIPIKGTYQNVPFEIETEKSFDQVWDNVVDLFAKKGLSIVVIDRSSGLIVSKPGSLIYTYENSNGQLLNPNAWVVIPKIIDKGSNKVVKNATVQGEWNVRIKEKNGKTVINVNLVNITASVMSFNTMNPYFEVLTDAKSTGVFEKYISEFIK